MVSEASAPETPSRPIRVTKNGNARTLTIPADIAERASIEIGDTYVVETVGEDLLYRRVRPHRPAAQFVGKGDQRALALQRGAGMAVGPDAVVHKSIDWNF